MTQDEPATTATDAMTRAEQDQRARKHVFCVNGASEFLDLLREIMQEEHYNVTTTNFVPRTHEQITALQPDVVIVDLVVGIRSGWDLLEQLQQVAATHNIPVIVTSTDLRLLDQVEREPSRYGGNRFIVKPFDIDDLLTLVGELIGPA